MKVIETFLLSTLLVTQVVLGQAEVHEWTNSGGTTIKAKFVRTDGETVTLFMNGRNFVVKLSDLKPDSQALVRKLSSLVPELSIHEKPASPSEPTIESRPAVKEKKNFPEIRVIKADWGGASLRDIGKVLNSTAKQLWPHASQDRLDTIIVDRSRTGPIVLYRRGNEKQYLVRLDTQKTFWSQYAFQFAHEFGHIICGYKAGDQSNQWFEESLCETASLFAMRRMREDWVQNPPYPNWKSYAQSLDEYAQERLDKHAWPAELSVGQWYAQHKKALRETPTDRAKNTTIATKFLPLFEQQPGRWSAVAYLNVHKTNSARDFPTYLADWKRACPKAFQKEFVGKLEKTFGVGKP